MKKLSMIIRFILTFLLIYGAYTETGIWTALSLFLIFMSVEIQSYLIRKSNEKKIC